MTLKTQAEVVKRMMDQTKTCCDLRDSQRREQVIREGQEVPEHPTAPPTLQEGVRAPKPT